MKTYRKGPIGALADEYEKVLNELKTLLITISNEKFTRIVDDSVPKKFQSIRTIVLHLVNSGYVYANHIRKRFGNETKAKAIDINTTEEAIMHLDIALEKVNNNLEREFLKKKKQLLLIKKITS